MNAFQFRPSLESLSERIVPNAAPSGMLENNTTGQVASNNTPADLELLNDLKEQLQDLINEVNSLKEEARLLEVARQKAEADRNNALNAAEADPTNAEKNAAALQAVAAYEEARANFLAAVNELNAVLAQMQRIEFQINNLERAGVGVE